MQKPLDNNEFFYISDKIYVILTVFFSVIIVIGNLIYQKFVILDLIFYKFEISAGAILYPLTFLITDLISEFYGKNKANFCVRISIFVNLSIAFIILLVNKLDSTSWSRVNNEVFTTVFGAYSFGFIASLIACYTSQTFDIYFYLFIKKVTNNKYLWIRNLLSTSISLLIDTTIVVSILIIFKILTIDQFFSLIFNSYYFKIIMVICCIPVFYILVYIINTYFIEELEMLKNSKEDKN